MEFNATKELIEDIAEGKMVILLDDEDRENEGDLVCAAELIDDKKINFMISKPLLYLNLTSTYPLHFFRTTKISQGSKKYPTMLNLLIPRK